MSYAARREAGPSRTAVIPSTAITAESLPAYLESPLLYSFPRENKLLDLRKLDFLKCKQNFYLTEVRSKSLTDFCQVTPFLVLVELRWEDKVPLNNHMSEASESPPTYE